MKNEEDIITLATYYNPMEAEIIRTKLEANGIPSLIVNESLGVLYPVYNQGGGGIKVKVFAKDLERSKEIINDTEELEGGE